MLNVMTLILLSSLFVRGVPINEELLSSTEELLPYKQESKMTLDEINNLMFREISSFLNKKEVGLAPDCIAISSKLIAELKHYHQSGYSWYITSFTAEVYFEKNRKNKQEGWMKISNKDVITVVPFCHL